MGATWIVDACVLIDLRTGRLLRQMSSLCEELGDELVTTDLVVDELNGNPDMAELMRLGIEIAGFSAEGLDELDRCRSQYSGLSLPDASVLVLAVARNGILITNEESLRRYAAASGLEVRRTLWVLQEMARLNLITRRKAALALRRMLAGGSWFPESVCAALLNEWEEEGQREE